MSVDIPVHLGFILDGNRRWAQSNSLPTLEGHQRGAEVFREVAMEAFNKGIQYVSGFIFSSDNWQRTEKEIGYLMNLVTKAIDNYLETFHKEGIRIVILGRRDGLRAKVLRAINQAEETTSANTKGTLALCFNYGGQNEIIDAVKNLIDSKIPSEQIDDITIVKALYQPDVPPLDLIIRTSGEQRLSGFMLWRSAYAELYFCDKYWPAFAKSDMEQALAWYANRERRFGN